MAVALNAKDDSISLIDTQTDQEVARSSIGKEPHHLMAIRMIITSSLPMPQVTNWCSSTLCAVKSSVG